ncbi:MAG: hypothetical protein ACOC2W_00705 [bacterium]
MIMNAFDLNNLKKQMKENKVKNLNELDNIGFLPRDNHGSTILLINSTGESVFTQDVWGTGHGIIDENEILFDHNGDDYYYTGIENEKFYLKDFMKK